ncbi:MAG: ATP-binding protein, partial [Acidobacteria bacterium]|nr:ATP-binding protein [Acidobacteriota bacterium]
MCAERSRIPHGIINVDGGYSVFQVSYPGIDERRSFLTGRGVDDEKASLAANLSTGFRRIDLEEARWRDFTEEQISAKKADIIKNRCGDSLELVESTFGLERASAQPHVRDYLIGLKKLILSNRKDASIPNGLLFVGVPGNGKSHITKAFAHDCGMNMLRFKNVRSQWVGESERNLNTVLDILPALAPCVVFIDEIDQVIHSRSVSGSPTGDSGVENRMLARLLEFMGDTSHRGDIIWIGATNRPDLLDPAMPRRLGRVFPFMNPTSEARKGLIKDLVSRLELPFSDDFNYKSASELMSDYSCDDVEKVVIRAREIAFGSGKQIVGKCFGDMALAVSGHSNEQQPVR